MRQVLFLAGFVEVFKVLARRVLVLGKVEVSANGDALQFLQAVREVESDVGARLRVVRKLFLRVDVLRESVGGKPDGYEPRLACVNPLAVERLPVVVGRDEVFYFHLLELPAAEDEVARRDFVSESLADLRDAEGHFYARGVADVFEVGKNALRGFGAEVGDCRFVAHCADVCLEHEVEVARRRERAGVARCGRGNEVVLKWLCVHVVFEDNFAEFALTRELAFEFRRLFLGVLLHVLVFEDADVADCLAVNLDFREENLVGAEAELRLLAVNHRVGKARDVSRRAPNVGVHDYRRVETHDVVAPVYKVVPPCAFNVVFEFDAERTVVEKSVKPAVDFGGAVNEPPALAETLDCCHIDHVSFLFCINKESPFRTSEIRLNIRQ